jgi:uncharacterized coiled-coil DUF342 family protein
METNSSQSNSHASPAESGETAAAVRKRTERLREKVADLSKTFDHIEKTLAEAADESKDSSD